MAFMKAVQHWDEHYKELLNSNVLRLGNHPEIMHYGKAVNNVIVLVHGLTDSPFFMKAIGEKFHDMGFNVLLPLLPGHGLKIPATKMNEVKLQEWKDEVNFAVNCAKKLGSQVSIGGLSTGGTLSTFKAITCPDQISGGVFLFSAALDIGELDEFLLRRNMIVKILSVIEERRKAGDIKNKIDEQISNVIEEWKNKGLFSHKIDELKTAHSTVTNDTLGIGDNPYRYSEMFYNGAAQLANLIAQIGSQYQGKDKYNDIQQPVFAAHSEADTTARIKEIELLINNHPSTNDKTKLFRIQKRFDVAHASVVLAEDISVTDEKTQEKVILEKRNPLFDDMMRHVEEFSNSHLLSK